MTVSEKNYKIIWGQFAARCCLCRKSLIHDSRMGLLSLLGEVAHIVGETDAAARGHSGLSAAERGAPENLMLLCREHHKIVDDDPTTYTVKKLHEAKQVHLDWLVQTLEKPRPWHIAIRIHQRATSVRAS